MRTFATFSPRARLSPSKDSAWGRGFGMKGP